MSWTAISITVFVVMCIFDGLVYAEQCRRHKDAERRLKGLEDEVLDMRRDMLSTLKSVKEWMKK